MSGHRSHERRSLPLAQLGVCVHGGAGEVCVSASTTDKERVLGSRTLMPTPIVPQEVFAHRGKKRQTEPPPSGQRGGPGAPQGPFARDVTRTRPNLRAIVHKNWLQSCRSHRVMRVQGRQECRDTALLSTTGLSGAGGKAVWGPRGLRVWGAASENPPV